VTTAGRLHGLAAMLTFGGLSFAPALLGGQPHRQVSGCSRLTSTARWLSAVSGPCFLIVMIGSLLHYATSIAFLGSYLGLGERVLVVLDLAMAGVLTAWAWRGCTCIRSASLSSADSCVSSADLWTSRDLPVAEPCRDHTAA
jgi:hypothetical protein